MKKIWDEIEVFPVTEQRRANQATQIRTTNVGYKHRNRRNKKKIGTRDFGSTRT